MTSNLVIGSLYPKRFASKKNCLYIETYIFYVAWLLQEHIDIFSYGLVDTWTEKSLLFMINHELTDLLIIKITCCLAANDEQREATTVGHAVAPGPNPLQPHGTAFTGEIWKLKDKWNMIIFLLTLFDFRWHSGFAFAENFIPSNRSLSLSYFLSFIWHGYKEKSFLIYSLL